MTTAVLLRSGMMGNYHVPFWRAVEGVTPSLTLIDFDQAILLNSRYAIAYNNRGNARATNGDPQAAIADYNEAIRINPNFAPAYNNRGNARAGNNDKQGAKADLQRAATIFERENNKELYQEVMNNLKELGQ